MCLSWDPASSCIIRPRVRPPILTSNPSILTEPHIFHAFIISPICPRNKTTPSWRRRINRRWFITMVSIIAVLRKVPKTAAYLTLNTGTERAFTTTSRELTSSTKRTVQRRKRRALHCIHSNQYLLDRPRLASFALNQGIYKTLKRQGARGEGSGRNNRVEVR
ncbi:hypothetical protein ES332_A11G175300v1 [Gossypium tomentosum]|uniref:Uncharacterized protein n=1 Tax=Gossypium tomentosum TaxID=34277 RepID=A0A5D2NBZ2_GOSTO|nr:hypothetical protein ES332_A11G175300v1 [Gossypium tomentosum]